MQKLYRVLSLLLLYFPTKAQNILHITDGTDFYISAGTDISTDSLSLTPSIGFTLQNRTVAQSTVADHATGNTYVARVFQFGSNTTPFSGVIKMYYTDAELNGLSESTLRLNIHNGTTWLPFDSDVNDGVNNYVQTIPLTNVVLNELALADAATVLPLTWSTISAYRLGDFAVIDWTTLSEIQVNHFDIERSPDAKNWTTALSDIPAKKTEGVNRYIETDTYYLKQQTFYRVKQVDNDGKFDYSKVVSIAAEGTPKKMVLYPNPVLNEFYIDNGSVLKIKKVQLFNNKAQLVQTWEGGLTRYNIQETASGHYFIRITLLDDSVQQLNLQKQ